MFSTTSRRTTWSDDLIRMNVGSVSQVEEEKKDLVKDVYRFNRLGF